MHHVLNEDVRRSLMEDNLKIEDDIKNEDNLKNDDDFGQPQKWK